MQRGLNYRSDDYQNDAALLAVGATRERCKNPYGSGENTTDVARKLGVQEQVVDQPRAAELRRNQGDQAAALGCIRHA